MLPLLHTCAHVDQTPIRRLHYLVGREGLGVRCCPLHSTCTLAAAQDKSGRGQATARQANTKRVGPASCQRHERT